jgi:DNA transposition AAA+ family ATPase
VITLTQDLIEAPKPVPEHLPGLAGAATINTPGLREIQHAVTQLYDSGGIVLIDGKPGVGKTFGTKRVLSQLDVRVHWADMPDTPKGKEANARIFTAVTGRRTPLRMTEYALTDETVDVLDGLKAVLVVDEAQNMTKSALRQLRYLHDRPTTKAPLVLLGSGVINVVSQVPELDSRVARRVHVKELTGAQLRELLPLLHPSLAAMSESVRMQLAEYARGNLRRWARVLEVAGSMHLDPTVGVDERAAKFIIRAITGGAP